MRRVICTLSRAVGGYWTQCIAENFPVSVSMASISNFFQFITPAFGPNNWKDVGVYCPDFFSFYSADSLGFALL